MEITTIQTQLIFCDEKSLLLEALMWNENKTSLKAILWSKFVHFDLRTKKSQIHSDELMEFFKQIENTPGESITFENRVKSLKYLKVV